MIQLSVIIQSYNRPERLRECLQALCCQTQPSTDFEALVVIDSTDKGTRNLLSSLTVPYALTVLQQARQDHSPPRNLGVDRARGRYLLFLDDSIRAGPALVAEHLRGQRSLENTVGIGRTTIPLRSASDWFARTFAMRWRLRHVELAGGRELPTWIDCEPANISVEKTIFCAAGGFMAGPRETEIVELAYRLMRLGVSFAYLPNAAGEINDRGGVRELAHVSRSAGFEYAWLVEQHPSLLPLLVGPLVEAELRERLLRRTIELLRVSPRILASIGAMLRDPHWSSKWFRFLSRYFHWSGLCRAVRDRPEWQGALHGTPILMYHAFTDEKNGSRFVMPVHRFARQMLWIRRLGFRVISFDEFLDTRREFRLPPAKSVVITIDDGYADAWHHAASVLDRYGCSATVFVVSDYVGTANKWSNGDGLANRLLLDWDQLGQMTREGIQLGAHTRTHPVLPDLSTECARREVAGSKQEIENRVGVAVHAFAYPYGEQGPSPQRIVAQSGFRGACGVDPGLNTPGTSDYALRRVEIHGTLPLLRFFLALFAGETHLRILERRP